MMKLILSALLSVSASAAMAGIEPAFQHELTNSASAFGSVGGMESNGSSCSNAGKKAYNQALSMAAAVCEKEGKALDTNGRWVYTPNDGSSNVSGFGPAASYDTEECGIIRSSVTVSLGFNCQ